MPSRSRRALLEAVAAAAVGLAGCTTGDGTPTDDQTATDDRSPTPGPTADPTASPTPSETASESPTGTSPQTETANPSELRCGPTPRPEEAWPLPDRGPAHDSYVPRDPPLAEPPSTTWSVRATVPDDLEPGQATFDQPVVAGDFVFAVSRVLFGPNEADPGGHRLQARERATGDLRWSYRLPETPPAPAVHGDLVLVVSEDTLYALDRREGTERWTRTFEDGLRGVVPGPERVYAWGDALTALAADGSTLWSKAFFDTVVEPPAVGAGRVYAPVLGGTVFAVDAASGAISWSARTPRGEDESGALSPNVSTVVTTECGVFVVTDGDLDAFTAAGEFAWHAEGLGWRLATDGATLLGRDRTEPPRQTVLRAREATTGDLRWERQLEVPTDAHGVLVDGALYVPTHDELLAVDPADGDVLWRSSPGASSLALAGETLFGARGDALVALR